MRYFFREPAELAHLSAFSRYGIPANFKLADAAYPRYGPLFTAKFNAAGLMINRKMLHNMYINWKNLKRLNQNR